MSNLKITKYFFVVDKNVPNKMIQTLHNSLNGEKKTTYYINANEKNKVQRTVDKILVLMLKKKFSRNDCLNAPEILFRDSCKYCNSSISS